MTKQALANQLDPEVLMPPGQRHYVLAQLLRKSGHHLLRLAALEQVLERRDGEVGLGPLSLALTDLFLASICFHISLISLAARVSELDTLQEVSIDWVNFKLIDLLLGGFRATLGLLGCDLCMTADDRPGEAYCSVYVRGCQFAALGKQLQQLKLASH